MKEETTRSFLIIAFLLFTASAAVASLIPNYSNTSTSLLGGPVPGLEDTIYFELEDCSDRIEVCIEIPTSELSNFQITDNGGPYASGIQGCDFDTLSLYRYFLLPGSGGLGPYVLQSWGFNGSTFSAPFTTMSDLVDSMNVWDPAANWVLDPVNFMITGGDANSTYTDMQVWHPSNTNPVTLVREDNPIALGTRLNFGYGSHQVILRNIGAGTSDTTQIYISCTTPETQEFTILFNELDTFCLDFGELLFPIQTVVNDCPSSGNGAVDFTFTPGDSCIIFNGIGVGDGTACIIACDEGGVCDTTFINVDVDFNYQVGSRDIYDTLNLNETKRLCIDLSVFGGAEAATINNFCPTASGSLITADIDNDDYCIDFTAIASSGTEDFCIEVCDTAGICDTTYFHLFVNAPTSILVQDTMLLYTTQYFCDLNIANQQTAPFSITNGCITGGAESVLFEIDSIDQCISIEAIDLGMGAACIYVQDSLGNIDTTLFEVVVKLPTPERQEVTLLIGDSITICIDTIELSGRLEDILNNCPPIGNASFSFDESALCLKIIGLSVGIDSTCFTFCDQNGLCDSFTWVTRVIENTAAKPIAEADSASVFAGQTIDINLCENDLFPSGVLTTIELLFEIDGGMDPQFGTASLDPDNCTLSYSAEAGKCGGTEELVYRVCDGIFCDTSSIFIDLICEETPLTFYNGFSPNGDGQNETLYIGGLETFPNNKLMVFNRWGLKVFEVENYQNDWDGSFKGEALPDGVYFYFLDNGEGKQETGSVVINR